MIRLVALLLLAPSVASAAGMACDKRAALVDRLQTGYAENTKAFGVEKNGGVLEVLTSKDGATWTAILTQTSGISCVVASGTAWVVDRKVPGVAL